MIFFRWMVGLPLAAVVTLGLFAFMSDLIRQPIRTEAPRETPKLSILPEIEDRPIEERPIKKKLTEAPPPPEIGRHDPVKPGPLVSPLPSRDGFKVPPPETRRMTPIVRVAPAYPESCRSRGAEGVVLVQFDVSARGEVSNVRVIASDNNCFNRTVIRTVMGWKYPPEARRGVTERFVFRLSE